VRNHQAAGNMKAMAVDDRCFFYHSNIGKDIVGIVTVSRTYHPDPTDDTGVFGMVEVTCEKPLKTPVTLAFIKSHRLLKNMAFVKQSRLSVSPVTAAEWAEICALGGL
jgi:predicted RNA-binding protein with PUA-like domain